MLIQQPRLLCECGYELLWLDHRWPMRRRFVRVACCYCRRAWEYDRARNVERGIVYPADEIARSEA